MRKASLGIALVLLTVIAWFVSQGNPPRAADSTKPAVQPATQKLEYLRRYWTSFGTDATGLNALGLKQASPECDFGRRGRRGPRAGRPAAA